MPGLGAPYAAPGWEPGGGVDFELPLEPEPMFGHGSFGAEPDFCVGAALPGAGVPGAGEGVVGVAVVDELVDPLPDVVLGVVAVLPVAPDAPAMPAAAPPVASAPATIVAPNIFDIRMR